MRRSKADRLQVLLMAAAGAVLFSMLVFMIVGEDQFLDYRVLVRENNAIVSENEALVRENRDMARLVNRLKNDLGYIEHIARKELGMVKKNEVVYTFGSKDGRQ